MRLQELSLKNFRAIDTADIKLDGKSTVIFGINGTGKSSSRKREYVGKRFSMNMMRMGICRKKAIIHRRVC